MALIDKASLLMVPSTYEAGTLYNVLPSGNRAPDSTDQNSGYDQTRADFTFDRGSNAAATRVNADGLIEKYRENKLLQSNAFSTSPWDNQLGSGGSITSGQSGYDGTNNAWLIEKNNTSYRRIQQSISTSGVFTYSVYAKAGTSSIFNLRAITAVTERVEFDLSDGTIVFNQNEIDAKIEAVGTDGWYRCSITRNEAITMVQIYVEWNETIGGKNIYIQNAQLESGLVSTDYLDSGATTAKAGVLIDLPRINYDANGENGSLLLEPQRQQLYQYSEYSGVWNKTNWTTTDNYAISPEGVKNAFRAVSTNNSGILYMSGTGTTGQKNTLSVWAKSNTGGDQKFRFFTDGNTNTSSDFVATTEWQRFEYTHDCNFVTAGIKGASSELSDILFYGFQQEAGSYPTSYIPNHGTSGGVTRAADSCSVTGVSDVIGQTEGVIFMDFVWDNSTASSADYPIMVYGSSTSNFVGLNTNTNTNQMLVYSGGSAVAAIGGGSFVVGQRYKIAMAYKVNDFAFYINGEQKGTDTAGAVPVGLANVRTESPFGGKKTGQKTKQITFFNERLTNEELATLTTL